MVELLVVISIIAMLIAILLPSLQKARDAAKTVHTKATLKAIGDGLEMFRNENEASGEFARTGGYPPSAAAEDQTEPGTQCIFGAQWLVRYLMGKDLKGYVPRRYVPASLQTGDPADDDEQVDWYRPDAFNGGPLQRVGPYVDAKVVPANQLPGPPLSAGLNVDAATLEQNVIVDVFGFPVLYYLADPMAAFDLRTPLASFDGTTAGIYTHMDNGLLTGMCSGTSEAPGVCKYPGWNTAIRKHGIDYFGPEPVTNGTIATDPNTFQYYILNKRVYDSTGGLTAIPYRKDSFLLISPGKDGTFGTRDDVHNF